MGIQIIYNHTGNRYDEKKEKFKHGMTVNVTYSDEYSKQQESKDAKRKRVFQFVNQKLKEGKNEEEILKRTLRAFGTKQFQEIQDDLPRLVHGAVLRYQEKEQER